MMFFCDSFPHEAYYCVLGAIVLTGLVMLAVGAVGDDGAMGGYLYVSRNSTDLHTNNTANRHGCGLVVSCCCTLQPFSFRSGEWCVNS